MKRVVVAILCFFYFISSTGATVHLHYCMNRLVEQNLGHDEAKKCGACGMDKDAEQDTGCCKDDYKQVKLENDHKPSATYLLSPLASVNILTPLFELFDIYLVAATEKNPLSKAPPRSQDIPVYTRNCVFRI